jgi:HSP20 family protein
MTMKDTEKDVKVSKKKQEMTKTREDRMPTPFDDMEREFERWFGRFGHGWMRPFHLGRPLWADLGMPFEGMTPSVDVIDREDEVKVRAELPGVDKKDLEVTLTEGALTIKGSTKAEKEEEQGDYYRHEVSSGSFSRTIRLPAAVDGDKVTSSFKDGILELTLPKVTKAKRHTIKVE